MLSFVLWGDPSYLFDCQSLNPPVLVFVQSKDRAKELFKELAFDDIKADVVHADLSQMQVKLQFVLSWLFGSRKMPNLHCKFSCYANISFPIFLE